MGGNFDVLQVLMIALPRGSGRQSKFYARLILLNWLAFSTTHEKLFGRRQVAFKRRADGFFAFEWEKGGISKQSFLDGISYLKAQDWLEEKRVLNRKSQGQRVKWYKPNQVLLDKLSEVELEKNTDNFYASIGSLEWVAPSILKACLFIARDFGFFDTNTTFNDMCEFAGVYKDKTQAEYFNKLLNADDIIGFRKGLVLGPWAILSKKRNAQIRGVTIKIDYKSTKPADFILKYLNKLDQNHREIKAWNKYLINHSLPDERPLGTFDKQMRHSILANKAFLNTRTRLERVDEELGFLVVDLVREYIVSGIVKRQPLKCAETHVLRSISNKAKELLKPVDLPRGEIIKELVQYLYNEHGNWAVYLLSQTDLLFQAAANKKAGDNISYFVIG